MLALRRNIIKRSMCYHPVGYRIPPHQVAESEEKDTSEWGEVKKEDTTFETKDDSKFSLWYGWYHS